MRPASSPHLLAFFFTSMPLAASLLAGCGGASAGNSQTDTLVVTVDSTAEEEELPYYSYDPWRDTLMLIDDKAFGWAHSEGEVYGYYAYDGQLIVDDPTARVDSLAPALYALSVLGDECRFDPSDPSCISEIKAINAPIEGFSRFSQKYDRALGASGGQVHYLFTIDYPNSALNPCTSGQREEICRWLLQQLDTLLDIDLRGSYAPSRTGMSRLGRTLSDGFFSNLLKDYDEEEPCLGDGFTIRIDVRARNYDGRFVTYCLYDGSGGGLMNGWSTQHLVSYDLQHHQAITNDNLFERSKIEEVKQALYAVMGHDKRYTGGKTLSAEDVERKIQTWKQKTQVNLPQVGLSATGFVFSFQMSEIDCNAAGAYHFTIPYNDVEGCLTPQAKALLYIYHTDTLVGQFAGGGGLDTLVVMEELNNPFGVRAERTLTALGAASAT